MKKAKLAVGILTSLMCVGALAACNEVKYSNEGYILTYTASDGSVQHYSADDLFKSYYSDADKTQTMFDSIYKLIVKNEFATQAKASEYKSIKELAARDVDGDKQTAKNNADTNGTSYDTEFDSILSGKGCKDEAELLQYYIYDRESKQFEDDFYENNMAVLRGDNAEETGKINGTVDFDGYLKTMVPYHVSHILVKLDDESATKYWNGTIGEQDCYDLYDVVNALSKGVKSFGSIANTYSEDTGSAEAYGDLGIMDKSTSFVDEFKLGLYAYENINGTFKDKVANSNIKLTTTDYVSYVGSNPTIPYSVFETYFNKDSASCVAKITKGYNNSSVHEDNALFYPRNIVYNEYLNKHAPSLIVVPQSEYDSVKHKNFKQIFDGDTNFYLCAEQVFLEDDGITKHTEYSPILVVRAGTSDYQGIHFITVNRNPFLVEDANKCSIKDYYTTLFPTQTGYPTRQFADKTDVQQTYVNFNNLDVSSSKDRADKLKSSVKSFDSNLQKKIYKVYKDKISFTEANKVIGEAIDNWIEVKINTQTRENEESFNKTFNNYVDNLHQQKNEREKRLAGVCAIGYQKYNDPTKGANPVDTELAGEFYNQLVARYPTPADAGYDATSYPTWNDVTVNDLFKVLGGLCNDGKTH